MTYIIFKEEQRFRQVWIYVMLILISALWIWQFVQQILMKIPFGENPSPDYMVYIMGIIPIGGILLFRYLKLETIVRQEGIFYRFLPFQRKPKHIKPGDIVSYEVKKYKPILDYGGWGVRIGFGKKGSAYNVSGNVGMFFEFKNGKHFLLGTQKPEEFKAAIDKVFSR